MSIRVSAVASLLLLSAAGGAAADGLEQATAAAARTKRPILAVVSGPACPYCRILEREMAKDDASQELARWTLAALDIERNEEDTARLAVRAIPALRILTPGGKLVAARDGAMTSQELVDWLSANYAAAGGELAPELTQTGELTALATVKLIRELGRRDATVREAALRRLRSNPQIAAPALASAFADGSLALRLAALELFQSWQAPVEGLDPWRPETIAKERLEALSAWAANPTPESSPASAAEIVAAARKAAGEQIDRLLAAPPAEALAIRERLARFGPAILPLVYERLNADASDEARQRLTALRYRLVATDELALTWPGGIERLSAAEASLRRQALDELATRATADDEPLLLELFSDPEPLVRELTLRALHRTGGSLATGALARLLDDPDPNVRAAVLKQLAEKPAKAAVARLAQYVAHEQDPDLLVHAVRVLRAIKGKSAVDCLLTLLSHESWRVRAEAAEAVGEAVGAYGTPDEEKADAYVAMVELLKDQDPFVVSRAVGVLGQANLQAAINPLAEVAARHPQLAVEVVKALSGSRSGVERVGEHLRKFAQHADPQVRAAAIKGLCEVDSGPLDAELTVALTAAESAVRIAAAEGLFELMGTRFREEGAAATAAPAPPIPLPLSPIGRGVEKLLDLFSRKATEEPPPAAESKPGNDPQAASAVERAKDAENSLAPLPSWMNKLEAPLRKLLAAESPAERVAGALPLIALGKREEALGALTAAALADRGQLVTAGQALRWLPWQARQELFALLAKSANSADDLAALAEHLATRQHPAAAELLWELLARKDAGAGLAASVVESLRRLELGNRYYDADSVSTRLRTQIVDAARPRARQGTHWQRLAALSLIVFLDPDAAAEIAGELAADGQLDERMRTSAFQVLLYAAEQGVAQPAAVQALQETDAARQRLALTWLALGPPALQFLEADGLDLLTASGRATVAGGPPIPELPEELTPELIRPHLQAESPRLRALAGYLLCLLGEADGLPPLVAHWRERGRGDEELMRLVYRSVAALDDAAHVPLLAEIYQDLAAAETLDHRLIGEFYWSIRGLRGSEILALRKRVRDEIGMDNLRNNDPFGGASF